MSEYLQGYERCPQPTVCRRTAAQRHFLFRCRFSLSSLSVASPCVALCSPRQASEVCIRTASLWNSARAIQFNCSVSGLRGLLERSRNLMPLMMGFSLSFSLCYTFPFLSLALALSLLLFSCRPSHFRCVSAIFSGSSDHPPSLGGERLCTKLPPVRPDSQAREQVPRQICR